MTLAAWLALALYGVVAVGLGWLGSRRQEGEREFWTAGRDLSWLAVGASISAGFLSVSWSCVYAVQLFYWYGVGALWLMTVPWLLALSGVYALSSRYHALASFSQPEMVGRAFGVGARRLVALAVALVFLVWGGAEIYVAATLLAPTLATTVPVVVLVIGAVVASYSALGGFRAVVDTDRLQYGLVTLYILAMGWLALRGLAERGHDGVVAAVAGLVRTPPAAALTGHPWSAALAPGMGLILVTFAAYLPGWLFETDLWLRVQAARDSRAARRGVVFALANSALLIGVVPLLIGVAALALYPPVGGTIPAELGNHGDAIFAALVRDFAPAWLVLPVAVGLVAACMSTIDTCANVMALSVAYDLLETRNRARSRLVTLASVAASCTFALGIHSLWDIFYLSSGILTTAVALPVAAVFMPFLGRRAVTWSSAAGLAVTTGAYFLERHGPLGALEPAAVSASGLGFVLWGVLGACGGCLAGALASRPSATSPRSPSAR